MRLADFIRQNTDKILSEWEQFAASIPGTESMDQEQLQDHARAMLETIVRQMDSCTEKKLNSPAQCYEQSGGGEENDRAGGTHAAARLKQGFSLHQIMAEFRALRTTVMRLWSCENDHLDRDSLCEVVRFHEGFDRVLMDSVSAYSDELDKSRQLFLGVLGHDLRNPLNAMMMNALLIERSSEPTSRQSRAARAIGKSGQRMKQMIDDLLDLARARLGGRMPVELQPVNLREVVEELLVEQRAAEPDAVLLSRYEGDVSGHWDQDRIAQMVLNLTGNALKHGSAGTPVTVSAIGKTDHVVLEVHNSGDPIPERAGHCIFAPLTTIDQGRTNRDNEPGIGLGLFICRLIAQAHGGEICFASSAQDGTRFRVILPRYPSPAQNLASASSSKS